jgi:hypothetical protein
MFSEDYKLGGLTGCAKAVGFKAQFHLPEKSAIGQVRPSTSLPVFAEPTLINLFQNFCRQPHRELINFLSFSFLVCCAGLLDPCLIHFSRFGTLTTWRVGS